MATQPAPLDAAPPPTSAPPATEPAPLTAAPTQARDSAAALQSPIATPVGTRSGASTLPDTVTATSSGASTLPDTVTATSTLTASNATSGTITATATLPIVQNGAKRILFVNGDFIAESGYPHSRVTDDGSKPERFSFLRKRVLEGKLALTVEEFILTASNTISIEQLTPFTAVVLGSNGRVLTQAEAAALLTYAGAGGRVLVYADFQYGPTNWASDNVFLSQMGIEVFPDNFQPTTQITDVVSAHPIMAGVQSFATEGSSQFLIPAAVLSKFTVLAKCSPLERPGCAVQQAELAKIKPGDVVACTWVREMPSNTGTVGRIAGTCDRNTFHNGPGIGTALSEFNNEIYATNLFRWLTE